MTERKIEVKDFDKTLWNLAKQVQYKFNLMGEWEDEVELYEYCNRNSYRIWIHNSEDSHLLIIEQNLNTNELTYRANKRCNHSDGERFIGVCPEYNKHFNLVA